MPADGDETLFRHYLAELDYLRTAGSEFARRYPQVAKALDLTTHGSTDPHVQRLIESSAFLTARLQRTYDAQLPEVPGALLDVLYPQLTAPIPAMMVAAFHTDPAQSRSIAGITVPAGTTLLTRATRRGDEIVCRFRTGYPVALWPLDVADAGIDPPTAYPFLDTRPGVQRVLRIRLRCQGHRNFTEFTPPSLRFYLSPMIGNRDALYELLFAEPPAIAVSAVSRAGAGDTPMAAPVIVPEARLRQVGLGSEEALLPSPPTAHQAYGLMQEYFAYPEKFMFFDVTGLPPGIFGTGTDADLLILLPAAPRQRITLPAESLLLRCTPALNLFSRVSEPIRIDHTQLEYRLVADRRRAGHAAIHSVERVTRISAATGKGETMQPLFSFARADRDDNGAALYFIRRARSPFAADDSEELLLSLLDPDLDPHLPAGDTVFAQLLCTNRGLTDQMGRGVRLDVEVDLPIAGIASVTRPTHEIPPPAQGKALWQLVSHLSLNHLSLTGGEEGMAALRGIIRLYDPANATGMDRLRGLVDLASQRVVRRIGEDAWRGFCRGLQITLTFDAERYPTPDLYLLGSVLSRFFGLHAAVNAFTELVIARRNGQREEIWSWPAVTGETALL